MSKDFSHNWNGLLPKETIGSQDSRTTVLNLGKDCMVDRDNTNDVIMSLDRGASFTSMKVHL